MKQSVGKKSKIKEIRKNYFFYLLALPGFLFAILFSYLPMAGIYLAFEDYSYNGGLFGSKFVGMKNFNFLFSNLNTVNSSFAGTSFLARGCAANNESSSS